MTFRSEVEVWRPVASCEGYEVSSMGRVRSIARTIVRKNGHPMRVKERILRPRPNHSGYPLVTLSLLGVPFHFAIHILVAEAFIGPRPPGMEVAHWDGDQLNSTVGNLRYATPQENADDRIRHGTVPRGERHWASKLSDEKVRQIRSTSHPHKEVAVQFGISESMIRLIRTRKSWRHVE